MKIGTDLLEAFRMVEVRKPGDYEALMRSRDIAANFGVLCYQLRRPWTSNGWDGNVLTKFGDACFGRVQLSYVAEQRGTHITFLENQQLSVCVMTVLRGTVCFSPFRAETATIVDAGGVAVLPAQPGGSALTADGSERLNLWVSSHSLIRCLEGMLDYAPTAPLAFAPEQTWPRGGAASLKRLVRYVTEELADPYSLFAGGVGTTEFEDLLVRTVLEGTTHNYTEQMTLKLRAASANSVRRAVAFMREHLFEPITVEDIARASGCSSRALAAAFRAQRSQTIHCALRDIRLDAARTAFAFGNPVTIGDMAARLGFSNAGRFARLYRERFGATPMQARSFPAVSSQG